MNGDQDLINRVEEVMANIKYVYKTHYLMAEWYEKINRIFSLLVAVGTALLAGAIIWEAADRQILLTVALLVAVLSWTDAVLNLGKKSERHYNAADQYHDLYEDLKDFHNLRVGTKSEMEDPRSEFNELIEQRRTVKKALQGQLISGTIS